ncbi:cytochrome c peroxidase [Flaviaesturariibacter amylovorans]|uniref:Cytochrome c peroxidase n=2 Tax=Flaviaesturariibacter amylovorans TaxID=1084520 RepID=A0ABP8GRQ3_9BACT
MLPVVQGGASPERLRHCFVQTRLRFKSVEWAAEYFMGNTTRFVNGPPVPEVEVEEQKVQAPEGLQVIEALLYPASGNIPDRAELSRQVRLLLARSTYYRKYWSELPLGLPQIADALRLEVFRVTTLGISGFDAPLAGTTVEEARAALGSVAELVQLLDKQSLAAPFFRAADAELAGVRNLDGFDRLHFIRERCSPLSRALLQWQLREGISFLADNRLLRPQAATLFDADAFDPDAFVAGSELRSTPLKAQLGKRLFYDPVLSGDGKRSCASCHRPDKGFADGLARNSGLSGSRLRRNTPTLLNAALQPGYFYDLRATNLENQAAAVIRDPEEMHGNLARSLKSLLATPAYAELMGHAFPGVDVYTEQHLQHALAVYVRSLSTLSSRFDRYMRGEPGAVLGVEERKGFNLFLGKARCGTCHFLPLFNGTVPPSFQKIESEVLGVPDQKGGRRPDPDPGRYALTPVAPFLHAFKTTTVRNAARTAPYMHNGVFATLEEVIEFYDQGGGAGSGIEVPNQTLPAEPLRLTGEEQQQLIAFLSTLNDTLPWAPGRG